MISWIGIAIFSDDTDKNILTELGYLHNGC